MSVHSQSLGTSKEVIYLNYSKHAGQTNITLENLSRCYNRPVQSSLVMAHEKELLIN